MSRTTGSTTGRLARRSRDGRRDGDAGPASVTKPRTFGTLYGGLTFLSFGSGPPLVFLPGLGAHHEPPVGMERRAQTMQLEPFAKSRRVWWVNRRPGLEAETTMADIARDYADAIRLRFGGPVDIMGVSTGGSVALQLAVDHPDVVKRLVVVSAAYRLGVRGAAGQRLMAREVKAGRPRQAGAVMGSLLGRNAGSRRMLGAVGWMIGKSMFGKATPDMLVTIAAEDELDLRDRLHEISAPVLIVGGDRDEFYDRALFQETAELIPNGRLLRYPDKGHLGTIGNPNLPSDVLAFLD